MGFAAIALLSFEPKSRVGLVFGLLSSSCLAFAAASLAFAFSCGVSSSTGAAQIIS